MALILKHQTLTEFLQRLRDAYKDAKGERASKMAYWLYEHYLAGDIVASDIRIAFGFDSAQMSAFATRIQVLHDNYAAVLAAQGE